jgi:hypothetical protein
MSLVINYRLKRNDSPEVLGANITFFGVELVLGLESAVED